MNNIDKKALQTALERKCEYIIIKNGEIEFMPKPKIKTEGNYQGMTIWNTYTGELNEIVKAQMRLKKTKKISIKELLDNE